MSLIFGLVMDWRRIGVGSDELSDSDRQWIGTGLAPDWQWIGIRLASDWHWIGDGLAMDWHRIGRRIGSDWQRNWLTSD